MTERPVEPPSWSRVLRFAAVVLVPPLVFALPLDSDYFRQPGWEWSFTGACIGAVVLIVLYSRGRGQPTTLLFTGIGLLVILMVMTTLLLALRGTPQDYWWSAELWWVITVAGALLCGWAGPWPEEYRVLTGGLGLSTLAVLSPLISGFAPDAGYAFAINALLVATVVGIGLLIRRQRLHLVAQRELIVDQERRALADELHDVIAHELTGMVVLTQAIRASTPDPTTGQALGQVESSGLRALDQIRSLVEATRDTRQEHGPRLGTLADVEALIDEFRWTTTADVRLVLGPGTSDLPASLIVAAHRVISEALTNIRRHAAESTEVRVELAVHAADLEVTVTDNGGGGGLGTGGGTGLAGVRERASLLGGTVEAGPRGQGWQVRARLPRRGTS